jgi:dihydrofolate reductase
MVIGGAEIYQLCLPFAQRLYLTWVEAEGVTGDAYFPLIPPEQWKVQQTVSHPADDKNSYAYRFEILQRKD